MVEPAINTRTAKPARDAMETRHVVECIREGGDLFYFLKVDFMIPKKIIENIKIQQIDLIKKA